MLSLAYEHNQQSPLKSDQHFGVVILNKSIACLCIFIFLLENVQNDSGSTFNLIYIQIC